MSQISGGLQPRRRGIAAARPGLGRQLRDVVVGHLRQVPMLRRIKRQFLRLGEGPEQAIYRHSEVAQKGLMASWRQLQAAGVILPLDQVGFSRVLGIRGGWPSVVSADAGGRGVAHGG